jgi:type 1 glutamine amidotransferase
MATILSPRALLSHRQPRPDALIAQLDCDLAAIELTPATIRARSARYDTVPPPLPATLPRPALLVFDKTTGFRDAPSIDAAAAALRKLARCRGWSLVETANGAVFNARDLAHFDAVVWNNVSGDALTIGQRRAFVEWLQEGGGYAGIHGAAGDPVCPWRWYAETLIGARFVGHPMPPRQFQPGRVIVERGQAIADALAEEFGAEWTMTEEWYSFDRSPRTNGARVLVTLDERSYQPAGLPGAELRMKDHPLAWLRNVGRGRAFYSAIGHLPESYTHPPSARLLERGIAWAMGLDGIHEEITR